MTDERPLSILMIDSHAEIERGGAIQCARLAVGLAQRGHKVACIFDRSTGAGEAAGSEWKRLTDAGVELMRSRLGSIGDMAKLRKLLAELRPDIVHTHKNRALYFLAGASLGRRRFGWVANRGTVYSLRRDLLAWAVHRLRVDRMIAVADAVRDQLIRDGIAPEKVRTIYGSFDVERFDPATSGAALRQSWGVPPGVPLVGMAASFKSRKKGQDEFLRAARELLRTHGDAHFVLVGDGSPERSVALARELGIAGQVHFPGFERNMPAALAAMDVVVCASLRGEGLTGSVREALAMARPVVSTDVAGNRELVRDGETGLLVPVADAAAMAAAAASLIDAPERAAALGKAGRALVLELCTNEARARRVEALYRELLAERS